MLYGLPSEFFKANGPAGPRLGAEAAVAEAAEGVMGCALFPLVRFVTALGSPGRLAGRLTGGAFVIAGAVNVELDGRPDVNVGRLLGNASGFWGDMLRLSGMGNAAP